jgi:hypothetical protein
MEHVGNIYIYIYRERERERERTKRNYSSRSSCYPTRENNPVLL